MSLFVSSIGPQPLRSKATPGVRNHAARIDHVHSSLGIEQLLFTGFTANMNVLTDQRLDQAWNFGGCLLTRIRVTNASTSLTTVKGGMYSAPAKGGRVLVPSTQAYTDLTTWDTGLDLTLGAAASGLLYGPDGVYLSLSTIQGAAATADIYVFGVPLYDVA